MRTTIWMAWAAMALLAACSPATGRQGRTGNGSPPVASRDGALLYLPQTEQDAVIVLDSASHAQVAQVAVGKAPAQVAVGTDDTLYVANRGNRSVSVIRRGAWTESTRIEVGVEPSALEVSADGRTLYVLNASSLEDADVGTLMAVDVESLQIRWTVAVGPEPRGLELEGAHLATIRLLEEGETVRVDLLRAEIIHRGRAQVVPDEDATSRAQG